MCAQSYWHACVLSHVQLFAALWIVAHQAALSMGFSKQEYQLLLSSHFSHVRLCATPQTAAHQALLSLGFSRQEYWSGCHFLLQCIKVKRESHSVVSDSSQPHGLQPTRLLCPWDFPGKSTGVGCHCLPRILESAAISSSRGSSWPRDRRHISCGSCNGR